MAGSSLSPFGPNKKSIEWAKASMRRLCNKHIPTSVSLQGEPLIVVRIIIVDYHHSLMGGGSYGYKPGRYLV